MAELKVARPCLAALLQAPGEGVSSQLHVEAGKGEGMACAYQGHQEAIAGGQLREQSCAAAGGKERGPEEGGWMRFNTR